MANPADLTELKAALFKTRGALVTVGVLSAVLNILLLGGSIYMMLIYDSVLPSQSIPTMVGLLIMVIIVFAFQGMFDVFRSRILADVAAAFDQRLAMRVQQAVAFMALRGLAPAGGGDGMMPMRDLDQIRSYLASPGPAALMDLPWILFFLGILTLLHVWLGVTALAGAIVLVILTVITHRTSKQPTEALSKLAGQRQVLADESRRHAELLHILGMADRLRARWDVSNRQYLAAQDELVRTTGGLGGVSKVFRQFLQSLVLTVGALLVIEGQATAGVIFASSILAARALAPIDQAIANWKGLIAARSGWNRLNRILAAVPADSGVSTMLPPPTRELLVDGLVVAPPGTQRIVAQGIAFRLQAGDAMGIIGMSGAGKSSVARAILGSWQPARGTVRMDGATLDQWPPDILGEHLGYLPQTVELLAGTVAENIARFRHPVDSAMVIEAAKAAGVHDLIVQLPQGYDTPVGADGSQLSAGQRQRVALARALFGNPFLVVLDEPNSNLDAVGEAALDAAIGSIRERGGIVIVVAHRPAAIARCNYVMFMRGGKMEAFGPKDEVLARITQQPQGRVDDQRAQPKPIEAGNA